MALLMGSMLVLSTTVAAHPASVASASATDEAAEKPVVAITAVSKNEAGNLKVTTYGDGALTSDQDTGLSYMSDAELKKDTTNAQPNAGV